MDEDIQTETGRQTGIYLEECDVVRDRQADSHRKTRQGPNGLNITTITLIKSYNGPLQSRRRALVPLLLFTIKRSEVFPETC